VLINRLKSGQSGDRHQADTERLRRLLRRVAPVRRQGCGGKSDGRRGEDRETDDDDAVFPVEVSEAARSAKSVPPSVQTMRTPSSSGMSALLSTLRICSSMWFCSA
jgi:hypothetical protein